MKEVTTISGLNATDRVYEAVGGKLIKIRLIKSTDRRGRTVSGVLSVAIISGSIVDDQGKAVLHSDITPEDVVAERAKRKLKSEDSDPPEFYQINTPHMITVQQSDMADYDPVVATTAAIEGYIERTALFADQLAAADSFFNTWKRNDG